MYLVGGDFSPKASFGPSAIVMVLRENDTFVFLGSLAFASQRLFPKQFLTLVSQSPTVFWANGCCFRKGSVEGCGNYSLYTFVSQLAVAS